MMRNILSFLLLFSCIDLNVLSQYAPPTDVETSSKLEVLPSTARIIPGDYVVMFPSTVDMNHFIDILHDFQLSTVNILYVYNQTIPSSSSSDDVKLLQGLALSNVSDFELQELLESELVATITPV